MILKWIECEHEENDNVALDDPPTLDALRNCGLLKFFHFQCYHIIL